MRGYRDQSDRAQAWRACQAELARRITGIQPPGQIEYSGPVDVRRISASVDVPASSALRDHERAFAVLRRVFNEELEGTCNTN